MARIRVISPDGKAGTVDDSEALPEGWRAETPDDVKRRAAAAQPVQAAVEGAARGVTAGLSDPFIKGFTGDGEGMRLRREENPVAAGVANMAGAVASPLGEVSKLGGATKLGRAAAGGLEGGLWGLGNIITEESIGDPKLTGEHMAASILGGTIAGAGANLVTGAVSDLGASALTKAFGGKELKQALRDKAEEVAVRAVAKPGDYAKRGLEYRVPAVGRAALDSGAVHEGMRVGAVGAKDVAGEAAQGAWQKVDDALSNLDEGVRATFNPDPAVFRVVEKVIAPLEGVPSAEPIVEKLKQTLTPWVSGEKRLDSFRNAWLESEKLLEAVGENEPKLFKKELFKARKELQEELFNQAEQAGVSLREANKEYANFASYRDLAKKAAKRQGSNVEDDIAGLAAGMGGLVHGGVGGLAVGLGVRKGAQLVRERGGFAAAAALDKLASSGAVDKLGKAFQRYVKGELNNAGAFGAFRTVLENASAQGADELLATHIQLAETNPDYMPTMGMTAEDPKQLGNFADKAERLARLQNAVEAQGNQHGMAVDRFFGNQAGRPPSREDASMTPEGLEELRQKLDTLANNPTVQSQHLTNVAPNAAALSAIATAQAAQYLLSQAPRNPEEGLPPALRQPWEPSKTELDRFAEIARAVANPEAALNDLARGDPRAEALQAVSVVYPKMYQDFKERMMKRLADQTEPLNYDRRRALETFMPELGNQDGSAALLQEIHRRNMPSAPSKPDGRETLDTNKNLATQAQRLENRSTQK